MRIQMGHRSMNCNEPKTNSACVTHWLKYAVSAGKERSDGAQCIDHTLAVSFGLLDSLLPHTLDSLEPGCHQQPGATHTGIVFELSAVWVNHYRDHPISGLQVLEGASAQGHDTLKDRGLSVLA